MKQIKNLAEAEEVMKEYPHLYLVAFLLEGAQGSMVVTAKEDLPLYKIYFMVNEINEKQKMSIVNVQKLT